MSNPTQKVLLASKEATGDATPAGGASGVSEAEVERACEAYCSGVAEWCNKSGAEAWGMDAPTWAELSDDTRNATRSCIRAALLAASKVRESRPTVSLGDLFAARVEIPAGVGVTHNGWYVSDPSMWIYADGVFQSLTGSADFVPPASLRPSTSPADQAGEGWLPIESAPKDGTEIDVWGRQSIHGFWNKWTEPQRVINAKWCEHPLTGGHATWRDKRFDFDIIIKDVTHYRLITAPPRDAAASAGEPQ